MQLYARFHPHLMRMRTRYGRSDYCGLVHIFFVITLERTSGLDSRITLDPVDGVFEILDLEGKLNSISPST